jgi:hypothetical protein
VWFNGIDKKNESKNYYPLTYVKIPTPDTAHPSITKLL